MVAPAAALPARVAAEAGLSLINHAATHLHLTLYYQFRGLDPIDTGAAA